MFWLDMISRGKENVGISAGVSDGFGINVRVTDGTGVFVGAAVFVAVVVGVGGDASAEHPIITLTVKVIIKNIKSFCASFIVISLLSLSKLCA